MIAELIRRLKMLFFKTKPIFDKIKEDCEASEITVNFKDVDVLYDGTGYYSGSFDQDSKVLEVALNQPKEIVLSVLIHEYMHFTQWKNSTQTWIRHHIEGTRMDSAEMLDLWLRGSIDLNEKLLIDYIGRLMSVELECEKMTVAFILENNIPIDVDRYIKEANAYVYLYTMIMKKRAWNLSGRSLSALVPLMPEEFIDVRMALNGTYAYLDKYYEELYEI